jgi:SAM-dependent methyltransferase
LDQIGDHNREQFDAADVVDDYVAMVGLTPCEQAFFARHVPAGSRVLDLGVGTGRTTPWLTERGASYVGIDYAPAMVDAARRAHPAADLRVGDASDLSDFDDGSFDVVVFSYNGIDYLADDARERCLDEVRRVLVPGGTYVFSTHNPRALILTGAKVQGSFAKRLAAATLMTSRRVAGRLPHPAFRAGHGWVLDHVRGGLQTHMATPAHVEAELARHGMEVVDRANGDQPARPSSIRTPWWYYAARPRA